MTASRAQFQFAYNTTLDDYRKLWHSSLELQGEQLRALERPRTAMQISSYLEDLNNYDLLTNRNDISGTAWKVVHPDVSFRDEAEKALKAFTSLGTEVVTSSAIARNIAMYEAATFYIEDDSRRLLEEWKRDLKQGEPTSNPKRRSGHGI